MNQKKNKQIRYNVRRELVKLECENCGADLELQDENYAYCRYCGQTYIVNELLERIPGETAEQNAVVENQHQKQSTEVRSTQLQKKVWLLGGFMMLVMLLIMLCYFMIHMSIDAVMDRAQDFMKEAYEMSESRERGSGPNSQTKESSGGKTHIETLEGIQSELMQQVLYYMFGKPATEVTKEELDSIRYIKVEGLFWESCTISYSTEDYRDYEPDYQEKLPDYNGEILFGYNQAFRETIQKITIPYPDGFADFNEDLRYFTNLSYLSLQDYDGVDFSGMPQLTMVECGYGDLDELLETNLPVEQIEALKIDDCPLDGLECFTSLKMLYLYSIEAEEMDKLLQCTTLDTLFCEYCFTDVSYEPLKQLTGLKTLYIDGSYRGIKDLSMISALTELENLSITCTDILNIGFVKDLKNLKTLRLSENGKLIDFTGMETLEQLEFLELNMNAVNGVLNELEYTELGSLRNLKSLALHTVYDLDFLYELTQLEKLEVRLTFYDDVLLPIANMKNLTELTIAQANNWGDMKYFEELGELPQMKKLTVDRMSFEKQEELFAIDGLEELYITNCAFEYPPAQITVSNNLKVLDLSGTYFGDRYNGGPEEGQEVLARYCESATLEKLDLTYYEVTDLSVFDNMNCLKELSLSYSELADVPETTFRGCDSLERLDLSNNQVANIDFVKNLPSLQVLKMKENYVTDLSPLLGCTDLRYVDAQENPVATNPLLNAIVVTKLGDY